MYIFDFILQLSFSITLGFIIGLERQLTGHLAGIRTNILICFGSCLFIQLPSIINLVSETARIESYIISGVGFLCSSVIFKEKGNVKGLNTGATLWCSAAIGVFVGANELILSTIATIILVIANIISRSIAPKVYPLNTVYTENRHSFCINITCKESEEFSIRSYLVNDTKQEKFYLISLNSTDISHNNVHIKAEYLCFNKQPIIAVEKLISNCLKNDKVIAAKWESLQY